MINDTVIAKVFNFSGDNNDNTESVAYIPAPTGTVLIIITSRDKNEYTEYYPKFEELIQSYLWFTNDVNIKK
jgi:hypothetical protein